MIIKTYTQGKSRCMATKFITSNVVLSPKIDARISMNIITWTIFATLRLSFAMLSLQDLQEDRFDLAYSALNGRSSAMLDSNGSVSRLTLHKIDC